MDQTIAEVLEFVEENDIKFIKLQFCDILGEVKNISIMASQLEKAFLYGISFDASSIKGFLNIEESDLLLFPDPSTLSILPWRPQESRVARFFCYIKTPEGEICVDLTGKKSGRGAYVCRNLECFEKAYKAKRLSRNLDTQISDEIYDKLREEIGNE